MFPGLDCSDYQGQIDWPGAAMAGNAFAFIKATEGASYVSPSYQPQWQGAGAAGLVKFVYHFWHADVPRADQLAILKSTVSLQVNDGAATDAEDASNATGDVTTALLDWLAAASDALGVTQIFYSSPAWITAHLHPDSALARYGLWLASWSMTGWPSAPAPWPFAAFWQVGRPAAVTAERLAPDLDYFAGPIARLALYGKQP